MRWYNFYVTLDMLKGEISNLPADERRALGEWLNEMLEKEWDEQIAADFAAGKLDFLIDRAIVEDREGMTRELP